VTVTSCHMKALFERKSGLLAQINTFLPREEETSEGSERMDNKTPSFCHFPDIESLSVIDVSPNIEPRRVFVTPP